jgi:aminoglycoside phosphotransferase (APT) family kinase protein
VLAMTDDPHAQFKGVKPVEERHKLDETALTKWLEANVEGFRGPLTVNQFKGGQSNPTYQLVTPTKKYVLRKKPSGKLLPSAHAVDREFRVMSALYPTG